MSNAGGWSGELVRLREASIEYAPSHARSRSARRDRGCAGGISCALGVRLRPPAAPEGAHAALKAAAAVRTLRREQCEGRTAARARARRRGGRGRRRGGGRHGRNPRTVDGPETRVARAAACPPRSRHLIVDPGRAERRPEGAARERAAERRRSPGGSPGAGAAAPGHARSPVIEQGRQVPAMSHSLARICLRRGCAASTAVCSPRSVGALVCSPRHSICCYSSAR